LLCVFHTTLAHAQLLAALRAWRNLELRAAVDGRNFNLCAERGLRHRNRDRQMNVVAHALKYRIRASAHNQEQVAWRAAVCASIALALQPDALPVARARLDAEIDRLGAGEGALAVTGGARVGNAAGAIAARAGNVELHAAAHLRY